jgi:hypothetical protein
MLDVHPPHQPTHTWKDFLIHIATITVGLLIAVSLEQTVEAVHRSVERRALLHEIHVECEENLRPLDSDIASYLAQSDWETSAAASLRAAPVVRGLVVVTLPSAPPFPFALVPSRAVWTLAKSSGKVALVPENLAQVFDRLDFHAELVVRTSDRVLESYNALSNFRVTAGATVKPGAALNLTPAQREKLLDALAASISARRSAALFASYWKAESQAVLDGVTARREMEAYILRAQAALPPRK